MGKTIGRNSNTTDVAITTGPITLNTTTSVKLADANPDRIVFIVSNFGTKNIWVKLQAASVDDLPGGVYVPSREIWQMPVDNIYTGEICAISLVNEPCVYVVEY